MDVQLRKYMESDFNVLHEIISYDSIKKFINAPLETSIENSKKYVEVRITEKGGIHAILQDGEVSGFLFAGYSIYPELYQFGYVVHPDKQGRGLATKAISELLNYLVSNTNCQRLQALVDPTNVASQRVLEKNGFQQEGLLRKYYKRHGELLDIYMYAKLKEE